MAIFAPSLAIWRDGIWPSALAATAFSEAAKAYPPNSGDEGNISAKAWLAGATTDESLAAALKQLPEIIVNQTVPFGQRFALTPGAHSCIWRWGMSAELANCMTRYSSRRLMALDGV